MSQLWSWYEARARELVAAPVTGAGAWTAAAAREGLLRGMGLWPLPSGGDLRLTDYGSAQASGVTLRRLAWQLLPDCWATGGLFLPDPLPAGRLPAVLYVCGHGHSGVLHYQAHGLQWARRGYACLIVDTTEQHDNPGEHHGLYYGLHDEWISLGYSGAGGELWNSLRGLDVLCALPEVDAARIGATGISGGGAHSLFVGLADDRVRAVATACGVALSPWTLAHRHLLNHCDCMYFHNVAQRALGEYLAALVPRPLLCQFAQDDVLFSPVEYELVARAAGALYAAHGAPTAVAVRGYPGSHGYRPKMVADINAWFDQHVAGEVHPAGTLGGLEFTEAQVSAWHGRPPRPNRARLLPELLSVTDAPALPADAAAVPAQRAATVATLRREVLPHHQPEGVATAELTVLGRHLSGTGSRCVKFSLAVEGYELWAEMQLPPTPRGPVLVALAGPGELASDWIERLWPLAQQNILLALEPRGSGLHSDHPRLARHLLRAGCLVGVTPVMAMLQDLATWLAALRRAEELPAGQPICLVGQGDAAVACLYHALLTDQAAGLALDTIPDTHRRGAYIPGILRVMDIPHAVGLLAPRPVGLTGGIPRHHGWALRAYALASAADRLTLAPTFDGALRGVLGQLGG